MNLAKKKALKFQYPDNELFYVGICEKDYVFRNISKREFLEAQELAVTDYDFNEIICEIAIVYPENMSFENCIAGIPDTIAPVVIKHSDFEGNSIIHRYVQQKAKINTFEEQAMAMVKAAMPEFTYSVMEHWPLSKLIQEATRAEYILKEIKGVNIEWKINEDEAEEEKQEEEFDFRKTCRELIEQGVDPIFALWPMIDPGEKEIERPQIGGFHWRNEEIMNAIRDQILRHKR